MKKILALLCISAYMLFSAQDSLKTETKIITKDTKFGLALSGGGAKGFAHIGILKVIDSLGIKVDYITGTSMGGILGGLYGMGYNGEELKKIVYSTDWKRVLSNKIPYNKVNISEKDEYNKYIIEFPVAGGLPTLPSSFIEGQYMSEVLNTLTFPAKHINDFSKLRIPVQLTSSDIVNGGLVMQKKGSLPLAIRSTLAIPAAFAPVYIDGKLLVDGGLDRNFPVQEVKNMGADYIIGGYTGFRLFTKKEIENPMKMIYQTHAFHSVQDYNLQKKMSDILVDFVAPLNNYTTKDFKKYKEIIKIGEQEAKKHIPEFVALADQQRRLGIIYDHKLIEEVKKPTIKFTYSEDNGTPLNNLSEIESIKNVMGLTEGQYYDAKTVNESIDKIFGMRQYEKVYYTYTDSEDGLIMNTFIKRVRAGAFKLALHYDNEQSVGIIVNYTYRNIAHRFRALATIDISERFKARLQFQKFLDNSLRWWISAEGTTYHLKSNDFLLRSSSEFDYDTGSFNSPDYIYRNTNVNTAINYNLVPNAMASLGIEYNTEKINRSTDKLGQVLTGVSSDNKVYQHNNFGIFFKFNQNNLNERYYPTSGNNLQVMTKYYFGDQYKLYNLENVQPYLYEYLNPVTSYYNVPKNLLSITINENFVLPITKRLAIRTNAFLGAHFSSKNTDVRLSSGLDSEEKSPYLFLNQKYNLGGSEYNFSGTNPEFNGLRQKEIPANSFAKLRMDVQYNIYKHLYLTPSFQYGRGSDELSPFKNSTGFYGYGLNLGYESILGPININVSKNNIINFWRVYFSIGFKF
ncbi:patatin [Chryseobacterium sp. IHB B 17019]|uniref:patatin-like phospholipase family protein n=1 Tax=Chryseobacterium sp. IHB B 17019 TaxID=1721091 RepID=UPI000721160F|nr:patatin-like phospholipase family protein [Chryseobacterium sp. IHB B 17019]ALR31379.1 patatin [Chryseobacterium sp. IHB B 17019]